MSKKLNEPRRKIKNIIRNTKINEISNTQIYNVYSQIKVIRYTKKQENNHKKDKNPLEFKKSDIELLDTDIKTVIITVPHIFKKLSQR